MRCRRGASTAVCVRTICLRDRAVFVSAMTYPRVSAAACAYLQQSSVQVQIGPSQPKQLALAHPHCDGEDIQGFETVAAGGRQGSDPRPRETSSHLGECRPPVTAKHC